MKAKRKKSIKLGRKGDRQSMFQVRVVKHAILLASSAWIFAAAFSQPLFAQEPDVKLLLDKISALESKVTQLEKKLVAGESRGGMNLVPQGELAPSEGGVVRALEDIHLGGYVSTAYNINTNSPLSTASGAGVANTSGNNTNTRTFDRDSNNFSGNAKLALEKPAAEKGTAGFRTDVIFGRDGQILSGATNGDSTDNLFLEQAYVNYIAPIGNGLEIKAGRFVTIAGAEVIESKDNWNSSRGLLFNNAIPFTHNGILASYAFNDYVDAKLGVANGWDSSLDNNRGKTLLSQIGLHPIEGLDFTQNFLLGPEQARAVGDASRGADKHLRGLLDSIMAWTPISNFDAWKILANFDYGWESKANAIGAGNAKWHGLALGTKYDVNNWLTLAGRWEYFSDPDGARIGSVNGITTANRSNLYEMTYTADLKLTKNLLTRLEWRYDSATHSIYDLSDGASTGVGARSGQSTIGAEMIYAF